MNLDYSNDIKFLYKRLRQLLEQEEYEKCSKIKSWIDDLKERQQKLKLTTK